MRLSFYATSKPSPEYLARLKVAARSVYPNGVTLHPATDFTNADLVLDASDTDEEMIAMFEYNASLVPWPGRDSETLYFDIESHNVEKRWDMPVYEFVRTVQWAWGIDGETHFSTNVNDLYTEISKAWGLVAHNGHPFDFSVLLGDEALTWAREGRLFDTMVFGNLANPAPFTFTDRHGRQSWMEIGGQSKVVPHTRKWLSLDNQAYVLGVPGKFGNLEELARKYNPPKTKREDLDFGLIPVDDEDFVAYARQDIPALQGITFGLLKKKPLDDYDRREQLCAAINAQISRNGWLVDRDAAQQRVDEQALKRERILAGLSEKYDFPTEGKSPWISAKGKAAILAALKDFGIVPTEHRDTWPFGKTGPSLAGSVLIEHCTEPEAAEFAQAIAELGGQRPLAGQALQFTHSDGKVHPDITSMQRSGRMCIPDSHKILTRRGILSVDEVQIGDETLDKDNHWVKVLGVHRYQNAPVDRYETNRILIESTPEHRWVLSSPSRSSEIIAPLSEGMRKGWSVRLTPTSKPVHLKTFRLWRNMSPREVVAGLVGFLVTDGHARVRTDSPNSSKFVIYQTESKFFDEIKEFLPPSWVSSDYSRPVKGNYGNVIHELRLQTSLISDILSREGLEWSEGLRNSPSLLPWLLSLTEGETLAFLTAAYMSDGTVGGVNRSTNITTLNPWTAKIFQIAAYRCGYVSNYRVTPIRRDSKLHGTVSLKRDTVQPSKLPKPTRSVRDVWCVSTETGTFTAWFPDGRFAGPYLTGNSVTQPSLGTWTARGDSSIEKRYFLADPGCVLLEYDMSNADARAVAAMSRDYEFAKRFEDGVDAHELTGRFMFGDELYDSNPEIYRFRAKTCIAKGESVLTDRGLVPIEDVTYAMKVWDGEGFVTHGGVIDQGEREVITYDGLTATQDHVVFAWSEGKIVEVPFGFAAAENLTLVTTERRGSGVRVRDRDFRYGEAHTRQEELLRTGPLPKLRGLRLGSLLQLATRFKLWVSDVRAACEKAVPKMVGAAYGRGSAAMSEPQQSGVSSLRGTWNWLRLARCGRGISLGLGQPWSVRPWSHAGPDRQQQGLRAGELTVGHPEGATREPKKHRHFGVSSRALAFFCRNRLPLLTKWLHARRDDRGRSGDSPNQGLPLSSSGGKTRVYDIYSAGPHNRFTVSGKLVHNCAHGFNYGLGAKKLARQLRIDLDHAYKFVDFMHASYPHLIYWQGQVRDAARIGYVVNDWGRKMPVDEDRSYTQSPSLMGQSSTRELLFDGLIKLPDEILRMLKITVHDAVVFSFPEQRVDELSQVVVESFETEWNGIKFPLHRGPEAPDWHKAGH